MPAGKGEPGRHMSGRTVIWMRCRVLQCFALVTSALQSLELTGFDSIALHQFDRATGWVRLVRKGCG